VKAIRTDRGTEYLGSFSAFMKRKGIVHQRSSPYTPEQDGRAERYNRTLIERTRALLLHFNLPTLLWGDAITTAAYLPKFMPKKGKKKTPWELFYDVKPSIGHLTVFGCLAMVHLPPRLHENKTDAVSEECLFLGYVPGAKPWRFLSWRTGKAEIIDSAHVTWREDQSPTVPPSAFSGRELAVMQDEEDDDFQGGLVELPDPPATADAGEVIYPDADVQSEDTEIDEEAESALHADPVQIGLSKHLPLPLTTKKIFQHNHQQSKSWGVEDGQPGTKHHQNA
jgi:hypothetical protein